MSIESAITEVQKAHLGGREKYTYFLLAAAGTAIGFAVQKVDGLALSWWLIPVGIATLCWGGSFCCGCWNVHWVHASLTANFALLQLRQGSHPEQPQGEAFYQAAVKGTKTALNANATKAQGYAAWQFRLLIAGAVFFIAWRIAEMVRLTYPHLG